jgi:hypothetical protein
MIKRMMTAHPASVGETYLQHLAFASRFGGSMLVGGLACLVHGVLPFLCTSSGSRRVRALHADLQQHAGRRVVTERRDPGEELAGEGAFNWSI